MLTLCTAAAGLVLSIACGHDSLRALEVGPGCSVPGQSATAYAVVSRQSKSDSLTTVTVCLTADTARLRIAGYHGELTMPGTARVLHVDRPAGGTRIENASALGRVSFAGVAANGFAPGAVLVLIVARPSARDDARIRLTMLDVTDIAGHDVVAQVRVDSLPRLSGAP